MPNTSTNYLNTSLKERFELFKIIRKHRKWAEERNVNYEQNKWAKGIMWIFTGAIIAYLIFVAVMFSLIINDSRSITSVEFICGISVFILAIDFSFRFMAQTIPAQLVVPYITLPISKHSCIDNLIATNLLSANNFIWFGFLAPYCIMSVLFSFGFFTTLIVLLFYWLLILINTQWYHIVRTLVNDSLLWWLLPIGVYGALASPYFIGSKPSVKNILDFYAHSGEMLSNGNPIPLLIIIVALAGFILINRKIQQAHIMQEVMNKKTKKLKSISTLRLFERYGEIGTYLQLEVKQIMRNKNPRKSFITAIIATLAFTLLVSYTDIYDNNYMKAFIGFYNFIIFGMMTLAQIMSYEGNYIDCLMVRKENIISLLKAKYIVSTSVLIVPFLLMLPTVFTGKFTLLMLVAYSVFTAGFQYFALFQIAVYNKQSMPMNTKFINKGGIGNNYVQFTINMACMFVPSCALTLLMSLTNSSVVYITMIVIGLLFITTNNIWIGNIYHRIMKKRYKLIDGFRATR